MAREPIPKVFDETEVFTFFGLAAYKSQVLERAVMSLFVALKMSVDSLGITQDLLDELFASVNRDTLGRVFEKVRDLREIPKDLEDLVYDVIDRRNFLIHHFFWVGAEHFLSKPGRREMLHSLSEDIYFFEQSEEVLRAYIYRVWEEVGTSQEDFERAFEILRTQALARESAA